MSAPKEPSQDILPQRDISQHIVIYQDLPKVPLNRNLRGLDEDESLNDKV